MEKFVVFHRFITSGVFKLHFINVKQSFLKPNSTPASGLQISAELTKPQVTKACFYYVYYN